jgi:hypothetical protein
MRHPFPRKCVTHFSGLNTPAPPRFIAFGRQQIGFRCRRKLDDRFLSRDLDATIPTLLEAKCDKSRGESGGSAHAPLSRRRSRHCISYRLQPTGDRH